MRLRKWQWEECDAQETYFSGRVSSGIWVVVAVKDDSECPTQENQVNGSTNGHIRKDREK